MLLSHSNQCDYHVWVNSIIHKARLFKLLIGNAQSFYIPRYLIEFSAGYQQTYKCLNFPNLVLERVEDCLDRYRSVHFLLC